MEAEAVLELDSQINIIASREAKAALKARKKSERFDLTTGSIVKKLVALSLPTTGTQIIQMAYNFANMFWLGHLSSGAVAASGTVGIFTWIALTLQAYGTKGAEIGVAQKLGSKDNKAAQGFLQTSLSVSLILGIFFGAILFTFQNQLIGIFNIAEPQVVKDATTYLMIMAIGIPFTYVNITIVSAFNSSGNSALPFYVNLICLGINAVLDPVFIFVLDFGIAGAAIATVLCQIIACTLVIIALWRYRHEAFYRMKIWCLPKKIYLKKIIRWGSPVAFETFCFTFFVLLISRFVASFGSEALAVQRIGSQIDSLSYLISMGFASALTAFIGQNYGAGLTSRIRKGYFTAVIIMAAWGIVDTSILLLGKQAIFAVFLPNEPHVIKMGVVYLQIIALCQIPACLEGVGQSAFRGLGKTFTPSFFSASTNFLRVALAWFLSQSSLGVEGIWWAITITCAMRGLGLFLLSTGVLARFSAGVEKNKVKKLKKSC